MVLGRYVNSFNWPTTIWFSIFPMLVGTKGLPKVTWISLGACDVSGFVVLHVEPLDWICYGPIPNGVAVWNVPHIRACCGGVVFCCIDQLLEGCWGNIKGTTGGFRWEGQAWSCCPIVWNVGPIVCPRSLVGWIGHARGYCGKVSNVRGVVCIWGLPNCWIGHVKGCWTLVVWFGRIVGVDQGAGCCGSIPQHGGMGHLRGHYHPICIGHPWTYHVGGKFWVWAGKTIVVCVIASGFDWTPSTFMHLHLHT
jgi:hypothetical protein